MSLASTVSSVIDVPATHSSGVKLIWPAWTEAISSSVESNSWPPADAMYASFGWTRTPGRSVVTTMIAATTTPVAAIQRPAGRATRPQPERDPDARVHQRQDGDEDGRPEERDQDERHDQAAEDRADRVRREQSAGPSAGVRPRHLEQRG